MVKVTYFAAFALPVALALVMTEQRRALVWALATGLVCLAAITLVMGPMVWPAYLADLRTVAGSEVRAAPGEPLTAVMGAPAYLGGSLVALGGVILLRQARVETGGLILLLLLPGFFYVTYQNYGNDPQWLALLAILLLALRPEPEKVLRNGVGWPLREALGVAAAMALALSVASYANLAYSPLRHLRADPADYVPLLPRGERHADLQMRSLRFNRVEARVPLDGPGTGLERYRAQAERDAPPRFMGEDLEACSLETGLLAVMDAVARDLEAAGLAEGRSALVTDLLNSFWLFGALEPLEDGAPWYYDGLPGWEDADYLLVPRCPRKPAGPRQHDRGDQDTRHSRDTDRDPADTTLYPLRKGIGVMSPVGLRKTAWPGREPTSPPTESPWESGASRSNSASGGRSGGPREWPGTAGARRRRRQG